MTTIPIKLDEVELRKIDHLVKTGRYKNRSQAIRSFIKAKLEDEILLPEAADPEIEKKYHDIMAKLRKQVHLVVQINSAKTALELVENERERM
jgi:Arc/MetJ-type ribon-helix-helix transcriptional regulator